MTGNKPITTCGSDLLVLFLVLPNVYGMVNIFVDVIR
jgi:hypothetical protein